MKLPNSFIYVAFFLGLLWFPGLGFSQKINLKLGEIFEQRGNYSKAIEQYHKALPKLEKDSMLNVYLTLFNLHQKQHEIDKNTTLHLRQCISISKKIEKYSTNDFYPDSINQLTINWAKQVLFEKALEKRKYNYAYKYIQNLPNITLTDSVLLAGYQFGLSQSSEDLTHFLAVVTRYDQKKLNDKATNELITSLTIKDVYVFKQLDSAFVASFKLTPTFEKRVAPFINTLIDSLYNQLDSIFFNLRDEWENIKYLLYLGKNYIDEGKIKVLYLEKVIKYDIFLLSELHKVPLKSDQLFLSRLSDDAFFYLPLSKDSFRLNDEIYQRLFIKKAFNEVNQGWRPSSYFGLPFDTTITAYLKSLIIEELQDDTLKNKVLTFLAKDTYEPSTIHTLLFEFCSNTIQSHIRLKNDTAALKNLYLLALAFPNSDYRAFETWFVNYFKRSIKLNDISVFSKASLIMRHIYNDHPMFIEITTDYVMSEYEFAYKNSENLYGTGSESWYVENNWYDAEEIANLRPEATFNGSIKNCDPGTIGMKHHAQTLKRIQFYRRIYGLPDAVYMDSTQNTNNQAAALMMAAEGKLDHHPDTRWCCYSQDGDNGASSLNLHLGSSGSEAIDGYISDRGRDNYSAGHRMWIFSIGDTLKVNSGDIPNRANALSAYAYNDLKNLYSYSPLCWPPAGPIQEDFVSKYSPWSFCLDGADFSNAKVYLVEGTKKQNVEIKFKGRNSYGSNDYITFYIESDAPNLTIEVKNVIDKFGERKSYTYTVNKI